MASGPSATRRWGRGVRLCREWDARPSFGSSARFSLHYQYTDTPVGSFFCSTTWTGGRVHRVPRCGFDDALLFRGRTRRTAGFGFPDEPAVALSWSVVKWLGGQALPGPARISAFSHPPVSSIDLPRSRVVESISTAG